MILRKTASYSEQTNKLFGKIAGILMAFLLFVVVYEIVARYVFNQPTIWGLELSEFLVVAATFMALGYTQLAGGHIRVEAITSHLPLKQRTILEIVALLLSMSFVGVLAYGTWNLAWESFRYDYHSNSAWGPPYFVIQGTVTVGFIFLFIQMLLNISRDIRILVRDRSEPKRANPSS